MENLLKLQNTTLISTPMFMWSNLVVVKCRSKLLILLMGIYISSLIAGDLSNFFGVGLWGISFMVWSLVVMMHFFRDEFLIGMGGGE